MKTNKYLAARTIAQAMYTMVGPRVALAQAEALRDAHISKALVDIIAEMAPSERALREAAQAMKAGE